MAVRISLTMIVKNEATALPECLRAARPWVDEIVVVDTGSADGTPDIARAFGAQVYEWAWRDDFAAARNESLRHATGDWVLTLDADETLTPGSGPALREACQTAPDDVVAYDIKILCPHRDDGGFTQLNWFPRLFRALPGIQWEGVIHEQVSTSFLGRGRVERSGVAVHHSGYTLSAEEIEAKAARNARLLERQLHDEPDFAPGWFHLAETYAYQGRVDEAIGAYRKCLRLLFLSRLTLSTGMVAVTLQNLGVTILKHRDEAEGLRLIHDALVVDPDLAPAHVHLGNHALRKQRWEEAEEHFTTALACVERQRELATYEISPWLIHLFQGQALAHQQRWAEAIAAFEESRRLNPDNVDTLRLQARAVASTGDWSRVLEILDRLRELGDDGRAFHLQRIMALSSLQRFPEAADACGAALAQEPDSAPVLALLGESLARAGRPAEAAQTYERLTRVTPEAPGPWLALAQTFETLGDRSRMVAAYHRAVEIAPESPDVLFALGAGCLRADQLEPALECLTAAIAAAPDRPQFHLHHVLCLVKLGEIAEAALALTAVRERWPDLNEAQELEPIVARLSAASPPPAATVGAERS
ncbi:MAG: tetratricopeptide repeat protein [Candidatus Rokubacteria bacterium]|nr:tetratricopeptide repeat protein [Candidatus Rokubacteria bacterium]